MSKKKVLRPPDDSSFCSQQCEAAYVKGLRRLVLADTKAKIQHSVIIPRSERETLVVIDCMAWNVAGLSLSGPAVYFPPQSRILNDQFLVKQVKYLHLCVEVKFSWDRVKKEQWDGPDGKTARLSQAFREGKMQAKERDTLFVILFNGTEPQKDIMASHEYRALSAEYLMVWYNQEALLSWDFMLQLIPLQSRLKALEEGEAERQRACPPVWAQLVLPAEDPTQQSKAVAFQVTPAIANIDGLKKAVKAEVPEKLVGIASIDLKVYAHDDATGAWVEVPEDAPLVANVKATAYHVVV